VMQGKLPGEKENAYSSKSRVPDGVHLNKHSTPVSVLEMRAAFGPVCPRTDACMTMIGGCDECPVLNK
jgi:hypothetical protein